MSGALLAGKWPAEVVSYDAAARTARVSIPSVTDGSSEMPEAVFEYPIGDRADASDSKDHTEIRVLAGDAVWVEFECGDPRFPIITGFRLKRAGNPVDWRRWRHANIEMTADNELIINAAKVTWNVTGDVTENIGGNHTTDVGGSSDSTAATSTHQSATHMITAQTSIMGAITTGGGPGGIGATIRGPVVFETGTYEIRDMTITLNGCTMTSDGLPIDHRHVHTSNGEGADTSVPK